MKPIFQFPRYELTYAALSTIAIGLLGSLGVLLSDLSPGLLAFSVPFVVLGFLMWQEQKWAVWTVLIWLVITSIFRIHALTQNFRLGAAGFLAWHLYIAYDCWKAIGMMNEPNIDYDGANDDEDESMVSFVLLRREPKYLEDVVLAKTVEAAWGGRYATDDDEKADGFVAGENPLFFIHSPHGVFLIHNREEAYWDNMEDVLDDIGELRLRKAVRDHSTWCSVDFINPGGEDVDQAGCYRRVLELILELADEDTLAIYRPETTQINVWTQDLADRLSEPDAYLMFAQQDNVPVIPIEDDNPHLLASVATAKQRWPEFVEAFHAKDESTEGFVFKARITVNETTEFIWLDLIGLEPKYVHGTLANDPVDLGDLKLGSQVEVPIEEVQDWCYFRNGKPVGMFSVKAIAKAQRERKAEAEQEVQEPTSEDLQW